MYMSSYTIYTTTIDVKALSHSKTLRYLRGTYLAGQVKDLKSLWVSVYILSNMLYNVCIQYYIYYVVILQLLYIVYIILYTQFILCCILLYKVSYILYFWIAYRCLLILFIRVHVCVYMCICIQQALLTAAESEQRRRQWVQQVRLWTVQPRKIRGYMLHISLHTSVYMIA